MEQPRHLLSFVTDETGQYLTVHADLEGVKRLIEELEHVRDQLELDDCPHTHLFSEVAGGNELTNTKIADQEHEVNLVYHVKIYGWNEEWAIRHGLKSSAGERDA